MENQTLSEIVIQHSAAAECFERNGLDYCCRGKRTLADACRDKGIDLQRVLEEINGLQAKAGTPTHFEEMSNSDLIMYIEEHHHRYVRRMSPVILQHLQKVAARHGQTFPNMIRVLEHFAALSDELLEHLGKEEQILFPGLKAGMNVSGPLGVMEAEHDQAGRRLEAIRELTDGYSVPEQACTTFRLVLEELQGFEEDLHRHVHLENNILFQRSPGA